VYFIVRRANTLLEQQLDIIYMYFVSRKDERIEAALMAVPAE